LILVLLEVATLAKVSILPLLISNID
jgi:hypothetical protein